VTSRVQEEEDGASDGVLMVAAMSLEDEWKCENEEVERIGSEQ
jgi:hypothetical protein